jgi:selenide,water dikinase
MIPGVIAGHYQASQALLDLRSLAVASRANLLLDRAIGLDLERGCIQRRAGGSLWFDLVSLDVGSTPRTAQIRGATQYALGVKPLDSFLRGLNLWEGRVRERETGPGRWGPFRVIVVGGGAAGVEVLLALQHRWRDLRSLKYLLLTAEDGVLTEFPERVARRVERTLSHRKIELHTGARVHEVTMNSVRCVDGREFEADAVLLALGAAPPAWLASSGLELKHGFVAVDAFLRSTSDPRVFGAGDCVEMVQSPRPKAGVFAVRQGPVLSGNLRRAVLGEALVPFRPQQHFLKLLTLGGREAVAIRGGVSVAGRWVWRWKDWLDRRWIRKYRRPA